ncbi:MAG: hypothetical protein ACM34I_05490 [bacterium]
MHQEFARYDAATAMCYNLPDVRQGTVQRNPPCIRREVRKQNARPAQEESRSSAEREKVERDIAVTDEKIDEIVYGLHGKTEEERAIIDGR